jgi:ABC-type uncharacterized transport system substrate-binding protein
MRRREFIAFLGSGAATWPFAARAQQTERVRRIGVLAGLAEDDPDMQAQLAAFRRELDRLGWSQGRNVRIDFRSARANVDQMQALAKELIALQPDVILAHTTPVVAALQRETRAVPIVFVYVADPIASRLVASLARPGGNITGLLNYEASITGKWLAMLREIAPRMTRAALVGDPKTPTYDYWLRTAKAVAPSLAIELVPSPVQTAPTSSAPSSRLRRRQMAVSSCRRTTPHTCIAIGSSLLRPTIACRQSMRSGFLSRPAVSCPTGPMGSTMFGKRHPMSTASCAAPIPPTCRCRRRPGTKPPSISRQRKRSA